MPVSHRPCVCGRRPESRCSMTLGSPVAARRPTRPLTRAHTPACPSRRSPASSVSRCPRCGPGSSATASPDRSQLREAPQVLALGAAHPAPDARRDRPWEAGEPRCRGRARAARHHRSSRPAIDAILRPPSVPTRRPFARAQRRARCPGPRALPGRRPAARDATGRAVVADRSLHRRGRAPDHRGCPRVAGEPHSSAPEPARQAPIVLACGPTDLHTIGLEALCLLLRHERWSCRLLGARTSVPALAAAVHATSARAVVIVSHLSSGRARAVESMRAADVAGSRCSTQATPSPRHAAGGTCPEASWAPACRRPASSSRPSSPEAFLSHSVTPTRGGSTPTVHVSAVTRISVAATPRPPGDATHDRAQRRPARGQGRADQRRHPGSGCRHRHRRGAQRRRHRGDRPTRGRRGEVRAGLPRPAPAPSTSRPTLPMSTRPWPPWPRRSSTSAGSTAWSTAPG